jgi:hypothetical protein
MLGNVDYGHKIQNGDKNGCHQELDVMPLVEYGEPVGEEKHENGDG